MCQCTKPDCRKGARTLRKWVHNVRRTYGKHMSKPCLPHATESDLRFGPDTEIVALELAEAVISKEDLQKLKDRCECRICRVLQSGLTHAPDVLSSVDGVVKVPIALREPGRYRLVDVYPSNGRSLWATPSCS